MTPSLSVKETLHSKIIRDADKLDILYAFSNPRILELNEDDENTIYQVFFNSVFLEIYENDKTHEIEFSYSENWN